MGPSWGSFSVMLAPFSAQVGLGTVFESTYLRKSDFSRNITFSNGFWPKMTPRWGQDRPKIAPRWVQDRLGSPFFRLEFSLRFLIVLGSILVPFWPPKWAPRSAWIVGKSAPGRSKTVPRSSWFGPFFVLSFGIAFLVVLGSSWGRFWSSWAPLRVVFGRSGGRFGAFSAFQLIDSTRQLINSSIQRINSSTYQLINPWPFGTFL